MVLVPSAIAIVAIAIDSAKLVAPSSIQGTMWQCMSVNSDIDCNLSDCDSLKPPSVRTGGDSRNHQCSLQDQVIVLGLQFRGFYFVSSL